MATLNLGRIKPVFRGAYAGGTAYVVDDIVTSGNETFICILASTGNATSNATYWTKLAAKGADGTDGTDITTTITTQGDILYRDGSGLQRLAKPASDKFLKNTSGGVLSWDDAGGGILNSAKYEQDNASTTSSTNTGFVDIGSDIAFTPAATANKVWLNWKFDGSIGGGNGQYRLVRAIGGSDTTLETIDISPSTSISSNRWYEDSPSTTSECTYRIQMKSTNGGAGHTIYVTSNSVNFFILETTA